MLYLLIRWILNSSIILLISNIIPGFHIQNFYTALIAALILSILNALIRPIILILTLPINILTLGIFTLFINAFMISIASTIVKGFTVDSFGAAFFAGLILWIINLLINNSNKPDQNNYIKQIKP